MRQILNCENLLVLFTMVLPHSLYHSIAQKYKCIFITLTQQKCFCAYIHSMYVTVLHDAALNWYGEGGLFLGCELMHVQVNVTRSRWKVQLLKARHLIQYCILPKQTQNIAYILRTGAIKRTKTKHLWCFFKFVFPCFKQNVATQSCTVLEVVVRPVSLVCEQFVLSGSLQFK